MAPHGCYRARGGGTGKKNEEEDAWIAIAISSDEEWIALCHAMGDPPWTREDKFASLSDRMLNRDELDQLIGEWTAGYDHIELMNILQTSGVKAGAVLNMAELAHDPNLNERGFFQDLSHPEAGTHRYPGVSWQMSRTPGSLRLPAPCFGEYNRYVFSELLGMPDDEISRLANEGVSASEPLPYLEA
jgi:crotonobetainyl-CoA:carnitine CoA-transferase CaiB-like acyl-CoA transferase